MGIDGFFAVVVSTHAALSAPCPGAWPWLADGRYGRVVERSGGM